MIPSHYVSLPLAKRMKEVGFKETSDFKYANYNFEDETTAFVGFGKGVDNWVIQLSDDEEYEEDDYYAYSVGELWDILPKVIPCEHQPSRNAILTMHTDYFYDERRYKNGAQESTSGRCRVGYENLSQEGDTLADAMALTALNLKERGII